MRRTAFGGAVLEPTDDPGAVWTDEFGNEEATIKAADICLDPNFGWSCILTDEDLNEAPAMHFTDEASIRQWLAEHSIEIER